MGHFYAPRLAHKLNKLQGMVVKFTVGLSILLLHIVCPNSHLLLLKIKNHSDYYFDCLCIARDAHPLFNV